MKENELESEIQAAAEEIEAPQAEQSEPELDLPSEVITEAQTGAELFEKYGNQGIKASLLGAARGLSFGASDVALKKAGVLSEQDLREIDERNRAASIAGEVVGVAAPALLSGGTSIAARGATKAGAGVLAAAKAGAVVEKVTARALAKAASQTGTKSLASRIVKDSISKGAGLATEGAFYGAGELLSEDALGRADLNAENLAASVGTSALISGAAGPIFSTAQAVVPIIKNNKIVDYAVKKVKANLDVNEAAAGLAGYTPTKLSKLRDTRPDIYQNLPDFFKNRLDLKAMDSVETLSTRASKSINKIGTEIDDVLTKIDNLADDTILPTKSELGLKIQTKLDDLATDFKDLPSATAKKNLAKVRREINSWDEWINSPEKLKAKDVKELKSRLQKLAKWERRFDKVPLEEKMARNASEVLREEVLNIADKLAPIDNSLGTALRKANLDYGTAINVSEQLSKKADKLSNKSFAGLRDILFADLAAGLSGVPGATAAIAGKKFLESDLKRKLQILKSVEKANKTVEKNITNSINGFFSNTTSKLAKAARPTSILSLNKALFSLPGDKKEPKTKREAFKIARENLTKLKTEPDILIDRLAKNSTRMAKAAPNTADQINQAAVRSVMFLASKMPKDIHSNNIYSNLSKREYEPSDIELSKFEKYMEAIENPMSVLTDLENGKLSREKVEALKVVYPNIYNNIRIKTLEQIENSQEKMAYQKRIQLGILMDIPTDASLEPGSILGLQEIYAEQQQQEQATEKEINPTMTGLKNIEKSDRIATSMQDAIKRD